MDDLVSSLSFYKNPNIISFSPPTPTLGNDSPHKSEVGTAAKSVSKAILCGIDCCCYKCKARGYTQEMNLSDADTTIFKGPIMIRMLASSQYKMISDVKVTYNFCHTHHIKTIFKIKCAVVDNLPGMRRLFLSLNSSEKKEEITVNSS